MKFLSEDIKLSMAYTNHSIRATVITTLDKDGFEARHIMKLSSHKSENTIKEYATTCPDNKHKEMFDSLNKALVPKKAKNPTSTVSKQQLESDKETKKTQDIEKVVQNLPNFDLEPIEDFDTIDDSILATLIYNTSDQNKNNNNSNQKQLEVNPTVPPLPNPGILQTQVNNVSNKFPMTPQMYFPHSNVTINYNFGNK